MKRSASAALLLVAASWGFAFVVMKDAINRQAVNSFLFYRFALAAVAILIVHPNVIRKLNKDVWVKAGIPGIFLGGGFIAQTYGLHMTSAAKTGFITGLYVVMTPFFEHFFGGNKLNRVVWYSIALATIGLALLSLHGFSIGFGELLVLICAALYTGQIITLSKWSAGRDVWTMSFVQIFMVAVMSGIASLFEGFQTPPDKGVWTVIIFTAVVCTVIAFMIQTWAQAHIASTKAAVLMTMETVFAAFFAVTLGGERLSLRTLFGGTLVVISMYAIVFYEGQTHD